MSTSVLRALRILALLAEADKPLTLSVLAAALDAPKSTVHGILRDLVSENFIEVVDATTYVIGLRAFEVGSARLRQVAAIDAVRVELSTLTRRLHVTSHYAVLDRSDVVYLCKEDPPMAGIQLASSLGARLTSHWTAVGKACLAWLDANRIMDHVDLGVANARSSLVGESELLSELAAIRALGYASDKGETASGIQCVAAPVFDLGGCCGAIGVSYLRDDQDDVEAVAAEVVAAASRATTSLGGEAHE